MTQGEKVVFILLILAYAAGQGFNDITRKALCEEADVSNKNSASEIEDARMNYLNIKEYYIKWQTGLYGSSRVYLRKLKSHLVSIIGKKIETDKSFIIKSPGSHIDKKIVCKLLECRWLKIHGPVDVSELKELIRNDRTLINTWWRSGFLFKISGKVRKFRIGRDSYGDTVELYFSIVRVHKP